MTIIFDYHKSSKALGDYPPWKGNSNVVIGDLRDPEGNPCGDVKMSGVDYDGRTTDVRVEVKSLPDKLQSMDNGRLQGTQLRRMVNACDETWLATYGSSYASPKGELMGWHNTKPYRLGPTRIVPFGYPHGFDITLAHVGIHFVHLAAFADLAQWLGVLYRWHSKSYKGHKSLHKMDESMYAELAQKHRKREEAREGPRRQALFPSASTSDDVLSRARMLMALDGVGFDKALAGANAFHSPIAMMRASVDDWIMPGIGKKSAQRIYDGFRKGDRET